MKKIITTLQEYVNEHRINETNLNTNFWKWFGNSKVVDGSGQPMIVNHGSRSKFSVFDNDKVNNEYSNDIARVGFWFSSSKDFGKNFANNIWYGEENDSIIYYTFLSMKNPKIYVSSDENKSELKNIKTKISEMEDNIEDISSNWDMNALRDKKNSFESWKHEYNLFDLATNGKINIDDIESYNKTESSKDAIQDGLTVLRLNEELKKLRDEYYDLIYTDSYEKFRTDIYKIVGKNAEDANIGGIGTAIKNKKEVIKKYISELKSVGYDGIIIKNTSFDKNYAGGINDQYIVFNSNQIKSVDNDGSWDLNDADIYS